MGHLWIKLVILDLKLLEDQELLHKDVVHNVQCVKFVVRHAELVGYVERVLILVNLHVLEEIVAAVPVGLLASQEVDYME